MPKDAKPGSQQIVLSAKGARLQTTELPLTLTVGTEAPAKLSLKSRLPSLRGTPRSSFEYTVTVGNDSGKDLTVALSAQGPANFQTTFTEGFGSNEISSIPIEAGQTKDIKVKVTPPRDVKAGDYPVLVKVAAEGATADLRVTLQISGQGRLALSTKDGRLSGEAEVGKASTYTLVLNNDGTAPVDEVEMSGTVPTNWKVEFNPKTIASAGAQREEGGPGRGDAGRQGDRRRLRGLVPRQRRAANRRRPTSASPSRPRPCGAWSASASSPWRCWCCWARSRASAGARLPCDEPTTSSRRAAC